MAEAPSGTTSLSPWWRHGAILVMIAGFSVLFYVTVLTYTNAPPIPEHVVNATGAHSYIPEVGGEVPTSVRFGGSLQGR